MSIPTKSFEGHVCSLLLNIKLFLYEGALLLYATATLSNAPKEFREFNTACAKIGRVDNLILNDTDY